jgi:peptide/nickel transport system permease protein
VNRLGLALLVLVGLGTAGAPWLSPNPPDRRFPDLLYAPPTPVHIIDRGPTTPFIHAFRLISRLERRFEEDAGRRATLRWMSGGRLVTADPDRGAPLLLLGADGFGRDLFSRLLHASRVTLALGFVATLGATALGALLGALAGYTGGRVDAMLMRTSEFLLVLPAIYVVLAVRAALPLVVEPTTTFVALACIFTVFGWPFVAKGVRAIVASEREREYVHAARALGAGPGRVLLIHILPSVRGHMATQATLLLPAFILAEATMSYVGLGFPDRTPTWGTLLQEAANVSMLADAPWVLAPAGAIFVVVLGVNLVLQAPRAHADREAGGSL